ncbi:MAG TPA: hypothetical protein VN223_12490 [Candidatus Elarobacter sp.]|nr:hypothetical protein [Candidatus Elarobacter sp.]
MPLDFVNRWSSLSQLADDLGVLQEKINPLGDLYIPEKIGPPPLLKLKSEADYFAAILGSVQRRTRAHERLVRIAAECLTAHGSDATTPHPIDLRITHPKTVIFEVKPAANRNPIHAIREAVGQLLEYRYFLGPKDATLCIVLDENPGSMLTDFVEHWLGMRICWVTGNQLFGGPKTAEELAFCCLSDPATA